MTQKELNEFSKKLEGKTLEELRKEEQDFIKVMDENDKKLSETKFKVPEDNFGIVGGFIAELLEKQEVQWQFATALVAITDFWKAKEKPAEIPFATLDSLPFFHIYGTIMVLAFLAAGASVAPVERFQARAMLEAIESCRATQMCGTPTMYVAALKELENRPFDLSSLQGGTISGAYCSPELVKAVVEKMGARSFGVIFGMTEALCTMCRPTDPLHRRSGTVGRIMPDRELKIVDPQTGETAPTDGVGELCVRGAPVIGGYYRMPEATAQVIDQEGWLHSGDLFRVDAEGYYSIVGRLKDLIIRGGENIYPTEIEGFLQTHPKVADAQVVGIPCDYFGEEVVAFVRLKSGCTATSLELKRHCRQQIALDKVPAKVFFVEQYPLTASGKVQKFKLREMAVRLMTDAD